MRPYYFSILTSQYSVSTSHRRIIMRPYYFSILTSQYSHLNTQYSILTSQYSHLNTNILINVNKLQGYRVFWMGEFVFLRKRIFMYKYIVRPLLFQFDPEEVHHLIFKMVHFFSKIGLSGLFRSMYVINDAGLERELFGL